VIPMRLLTTFAAAVLLAAGVFAQTDDDAIRALVQKYMDARELQDAQAVASLFTADADQLVSSGEWRKGREELVKGTLASSRNATGKRTVTLTSIRYIVPGVALADGRYELGDRKMWSSFVLAETPQGWKIAAIRNMLPAAPAQ
jgi:uncharacterized protein (TIGR02246 family)